MSIKELVVDVAGDLDQTHANARIIIDSVFGCVAGRLVNGEDVRIPGFGTFKMKTVAARKGRNPATGEVIDIPTKEKVTFKAVK